MKLLKISCQKHKIGSLLLSPRCITNYMKTCSFLHAHFTESMKKVENLFIEKLMVKNLLLKRIMLQVHIGIASMMQFQCVPTTYDTEHMENSLKRTLDSLLFNLPKF